MNERRASVLSTFAFGALFGAIVTDWVGWERAQLIVVLGMAIAATVSLAVELRSRRS